MFTDNFTENVPLGSFPAAVSGKWTAYPYPWPALSSGDRGAALRYRHTLEHDTAGPVDRWQLVEAAVSLALRHGGPEAS